MTPRPPAAEFRCIHCGVTILVAHSVSGVNNRNHCPFCLWSRHLDLFSAGDRLSACKAPMRPLGLTVKPNRNKYAPGGGELMLVHACVDCGRLSINRIAADDDTRLLLELFTAASVTTTSHSSLLEANGIRLLERGDAPIVHRQLLGESAVHAV